ncbi:lysophospholipid acyltransferase family protein [Sphaerisporangium fuscum]|uniref:lysophospholipid acyltransferase family protein n=1 Tax=Sphaerisporangium fuscum TaxID=2835868 RepID=UPI001BDCA583|nr:lysophospholipid acyltransferase family protein [Sphaerisporangium fuscum]
MNGWLPGSPCSAGACVTPAAQAAGPVRRAARLLGVVVVVLAGLPCALLAGDARRAAVTSAWCRAFLRVLGVRLEVRRSLGATREAASSGALVVGNHISWLDPLVVAAAMPCRPLAKSEIARWPVIRSLVAGGGAIFIDRERLSTLPATVREVGDALRSGRSVSVFPEGTTWCGRGMGAFRPAMFQAAIDADAPVRPIGLRFLDGDGDLATTAAFVGDDTLLASLCRVVAARGLVVEVTVFPEITFQGRGEVTRRSLARTAQAVVSGGLRPRHEVPAAA